MGRKGAAARKRARQGLPPVKRGTIPWVNGTKQVFFEGFKDQYLAAAEMKDTGSFYDLAADEYLKVYGYNTPWKGDLPPGEKVASDVNPDEDVNCLTVEEGEKRAVYFKQLRAKIGVWYNSKYGGGVEKAQQKVSFRQVFDKPELDPTPPVKDREIHYYSRHFYDQRIKPRFTARWEAAKKLPNPPKPVALRGKITREMWAAETPAFKAEVVRALEEEHRAANNAYEIAVSGDIPTTAEGYDIALNNAAYYLQPFVDAAAERFGMNVSLLMCGPVADRGGRIEVRSVHAGKSNGMVPRIWADYDRAGFDAAQRSLVDFSHHCFTVEECRGRSLNGMAMVDEDVSASGDVTSDVTPDAPTPGPASGSSGGAAVPANPEDARPTARVEGPEEPGGASTSTVVNGTFDPLGTMSAMDQRALDGLLTLEPSQLNLDLFDDPRFGPTENLGSLGLEDPVGMVNYFGGGGADERGRAGDRGKGKRDRRRRAHHHNPILPHHAHDHSTIHDAVRDTAVRDTTDYDAFCNDGVRDTVCNDADRDTADYDAVCNDADRDTADCDTADYDTAEYDTVADYDAVRDTSSRDECRTRYQPRTITSRTTQTQASAGNKKQPAEGAPAPAEDKAAGTDDDGEGEMWENQDMSRWPVELQNAFAGFARGRTWGGKEWKACILKLLAFEKAWGFREKGMLSTSTEERPDNIQKFMGYGRKWGSPMALGMEIGPRTLDESFASQWWLWWGVVQPKARQSMDGEWKEVKSVEVSAWKEVVAKMSGRNGMSLYVGALLWWGEAAAEAEDGSEALLADWRSAVEEVTAVLEQATKVVGTVAANAAVSRGAAKPVPKTRGTKRKTPDSQPNAVNKENRPLRKRTRQSV
ncbi:hypothetical protein C8R47DRAFT_1231038 [Mycena vitilis]|nr:hypothetical protein C8R47DRAFT_1231038 [Mycena vitilis]